MLIYIVSYHWDTLLTKLHRREKAPSRLDTDSAKHSNLTFLLREIFFSGVVVIEGNKMKFSLFQFGFSRSFTIFRRMLFMAGDTLFLIMGRVLRV
jgi:hypothetical protein